ncbi:hypothetical protein GCM10022419_096640 [Nonomuraea rosea]|uniref:Uncharacterized protein n=1 Tax=Nonomuraea rosea TaxID=638574 RepID=A0ABP6Z5L3_9ACTN
MSRTEEVRTGRRGGVAVAFHHCPAQLLQVTVGHAGFLEPVLTWLVLVVPGSLS